MSHFLLVAEREGVIAIGRDDLLKYAGPSQIIACTLTARLFARAFADLSPDQPPQRDTIRVKTAFPGEGVLDGIEFITRARSHHRLTVDPQAGPDTAPAAAGGRFYFEIAIGNRARSYRPCAGLFDPPFEDMVGRYQDGAGTPEEQRAYLAFKQDIIARLMAKPLEDLFIAEEVTE